MDVCKCVVTLWHGDTLNSRRAASPLVRLVERRERWEVLDHPQDVLPQHWDATRGLLVTSTPELAPHQRRRIFELSTDLACIAALHGGFLVVLGSNS
ncbi:hypothetical protein TNCV_3330471 [Trichonephila clavipes]|nr:hypothetical protein TNCV_3330471 [Trichonephila clavipes]